VKPEDLLRRVREGEPRYARSDLTLANFFTATRILLVPVFGYLWAIGEAERALWVFAAAASTDLVDGFLARFLNQKSRLGALLDPIADKLLMLVALLVGIKIGAIPVWLAAIILARDLLLLVGVVLLGTVWKGRHGPQAWRPTRVGKYAMAFQSFTIAMTIVDTAIGPPWLRGYLESAMVITAIVTVAAGAQYTLRAIGEVRRPAARSPVA
jgi:cardiolipin synthase (CMP-forming)